MYTYIKTDFLAWYSTWFIPKPVNNHVFMIVDKHMTRMLKHFLYYCLYCLYREKLSTEILKSCKCKPVCFSVVFHSMISQELITSVLVTVMHVCVFKTHSGCFEV